MVLSIVWSHRFLNLLSLFYHFKNWQQPRLFPSMLKNKRHMRRTAWEFDSGPAKTKRKKTVRSGRCTVLIVAAGFDGYGRVPFQFKWKGKYDSSEPFSRGCTASMLFSELLCPDSTADKPLINKQEILLAAEFLLGISLPARSNENVSFI